MQPTPERTELIVPIVHLNGTSKQELIDQRCRVIDSLHAAGSTLAAACPNGRDMYPDPGRMEKAESQHKRRMDTLKSLIAEIEAEVQAIDEQGRQRT